MVTEALKLNFTKYVKPEEYDPNINEGVIVEVGVGGFPAAAISWELTNKIRKGAFYIGIDRDVDDIPMESVAGLYVQGDMATLPFPAGVVDEIWVMNVFGRMDEYDSQFRQYFSELSRILKSKGNVIIGENNTPAGWLRTINYIEFGLSREDFVRGGVNLKRYWEFVERYKITGEYTNLHTFAFGPPFFMTLTKI